MYFYIDKIAFSVFGKDIYWYGIIIALAILVCMFLAKKQNKTYGIKYDDIENFALITIPFCIIGARLYYVLFNLSYYSKNFLDIFKIWNGGLAIYGGIIAAVLTAFVYCKKLKINILDLLDACAPYLALGQAIGRWGNFVNREAYGVVTNSFFRMEIINDFGKLISVHPTFLYESIGLIIIFMVLIKTNRKYKGEITLKYFAGYGFIRFFIEYLRTDSLMFFNIKVSMLLSLVLFIVSVTLLIKNRHKKTA
ncbi:MAG: prolipoprotein diacylglyceryl transferase [Clostridia bacterium]|nr:prolipoprotein diacylglyceryl transferase [Clostridia bacterium]